MLLAEHESDRVAELDQLGLAEMAMQALPELGVRPVGIPRDRVGLHHGGELPD